jgi:hypothetical protein
MPASMAATKTAALTSPQAAEHQAPVDLVRLGQVQGTAQKAGGALAGQREGEEAHGDGAAHDEGERGIPVAEQVQEAEHLAGVGHAGEQQAQAEQQAHEKFGDAVHELLLTERGEPRKPWRSPRP